MKKKSLFKQHFATIFRPLTKKIMVLIYHITILVHFTMLALAKLPILSMFLQVQTHYPFLTSQLRQDSGRLHSPTSHACYLTHHGPPKHCGVTRLIGHLKGCRHMCLASRVGQEPWAIKLPPFQSLDRVHLLFEVGACGQKYSIMQKNEKQ